MDFSGSMYHGFCRFSLLKSNMAGWKTTDIDGILSGKITDHLRKVVMLLQYRRGTDCNDNSIHHYFGGNTQFPVRVYENAV